MAREPDIRAEADDYLQDLGLFLDDLPEIAAEWDNMGDTERGSLQWEWRHLSADMLKVVQDGQRSGDLSATQEKTLAQIESRIQSKAVRDALKKMNVPIPENIPGLTD